MTGSVDWTSESATDFESRISETLEELQRMKFRLESELEDGQAALNAEATVCTFLSEQRRELRNKTEDENKKNQNTIHERTADLRATNKSLDKVHTAVKSPSSLYIRIY